jgi:hypothetical protein
MKKELPTLPVVVLGAQYPQYLIDNTMEKVTKTSPEEYMKAIKELGLEIKRYKECLEFKGFKLCGDVTSTGLYAKKEVFVQ